MRNALYFRDISGYLFHLMFGSKGQWKWGWQGTSESESGLMKDTQEAKGPLTSWTLGLDSYRSWACGLIGSTGYEDQKYCFMGPQNRRYWLPFSSTPSFPPLGNLSGRGCLQPSNFLINNYVYCAFLIVEQQTGFPLLCSSPSAYRAISSSPFCRTDSLDTVLRWSPSCPLQGRQ